ncbi:hypothetical protein Tco_0937705 [Tanacetum coccineum]|uniref:Uncharacterized protein n=1 Tax=Tanacetum coccineum TaxID=301880 RepID=A0ABQ5DFP6_9ASTR
MFENTEREESTVSKKCASIHMTFIGTLCMAERVQTVLDYLESQGYDYVCILGLGRGYWDVGVSSNIHEDDRIMVGVTQIQRDMGAIDGMGLSMHGTTKDLVEVQTWYLTWWDFAAYDHRLGTSGSEEHDEGFNKSRESVGATGREDDSWSMDVLYDIDMCVMGVSVGCGGSYVGLDESCAREFLWARVGVEGHTNENSSVYID